MRSAVALFFIAAFFYAASSTTSASSTLIKYCLSNEKAILKGGHVVDCNQPLPDISITKAEGGLVFVKYLDNEKYIDKHPEKKFGLYGRLILTCHDPRAVSNFINAYSNATRKGLLVRKRGAVSAAVLVADPSAVRGAGSYGKTTIIYKLIDSVSANDGSFQLSSACPRKPIQITVFPHSSEIRTPLTAFFGVKLVTNIEPSPVPAAAAKLIGTYLPLLFASGVNPKFQEVVDGLQAYTQNTTSFFDSFDSKTYPSIDFPLDRSMNKLEIYHNTRKIYSIKTETVRSVAETYFQQGEATYFRSAVRAFLDEFQIDSEKIQAARQDLFNTTIGGNGDPLFDSVGSLKPTYLSSTGNVGTLCNAVRKHSTYPELDISPNDTIPSYLFALAAFEGRAPQERNLIEPYIYKCIGKSAVVENHRIGFFGRGWDLFEKAADEYNTTAAEKKRRDDLDAIAEDGFPADEINKTLDEIGTILKYESLEKSPQWLVDEKINSKFGPSAFVMGGPIFAEIPDSNADKQVFSLLEQIRNGKTITNFGCYDLLDKNRIAIALVGVEAPTDEDQKAVKIYQARFSFYKALNPKNNKKSIRFLDSIRFLNAEKHVCETVKLRRPNGCGKSSWKPWTETGCRQYFDQ